MIYPKIDYVRDIPSKVRQMNPVQQYIVETLDVLKAGEIVRIEVNAKLDKEERKKLNKKYRYAIRVAGKKYACKFSVRERDMNLYVKRMS